MPQALQHGAFDWEDLYDRYFSLLFRYSLRFTADRDMVKDLLQDFFIALYLKEISLENVVNIRPYLMVCLRRKLLRRLLEQSRHPSVQIEEETHDFFLELSAESKLELTELTEARRRTLQKALDQLSRRQKEAVYLRFYENMSYEEIADIMGMKEVKYARTLVYRAVSVIKVALRNSSSLIYLLLMQIPPRGASEFFKKSRFF